MINYKPASEQQPGELLVLRGLNDISGEMHFQQQRGNGPLVTFEKLSFARTAASILNKRHKAKGWHYMPVTWLQDKPEPCEF